MTLDVGAYAGYYALLAAHANPAARVIALEPMPGIHGDLPVVEDPEAYAYLREEGGGLLFGLFEPEGASWSPRAIPDDASFLTLPPDLLVPLQPGDVIIVSGSISDIFVRVVQVMANIAIILNVIVLANRL